MRGSFLRDSPFGKRTAPVELFRQCYGILPVDSSPSYFRPTCLTAASAWERSINSLIGFASLYFR